MSLYGDLPQARNASSSETPSWAASKPQSNFRKPNLLAPPAALLRAGRGGGRGAATPGRGPPRTPSDVSLPPTPASSFNIFSLAGPIKDEYDPMRPNDYEDIIREREQRKQEAQLEEERQARKREQLREQEELQQRQRAEQAHATQHIAPAEARQAADDQRAKALNLSGEEAWMRRAALSGRLPPSASTPATPSGRDTAAEDNSAAKGMNLAKNLLQKMGWKEGEGLGRNRQGMSVPLVAQKTDRRAGVIVKGQPSAQPPGEGVPAAEKKQRVGAVVQGTPTRVVCLRNMVGPGEVDEDLEDEVGQESTKYGQVTSVLIYEVITPGFAPEEAVRIFVQFDRPESATKALVDFQGRFFGGRQVRASFFDEGRFERADLAPAPGEFSS